MLKLQQLLRVLGAPTYTLNQFQTEYPNNDACLEYIMARKHPVCRCGKDRWYRVKGRPLYACSCGKQISPLAGTIFEGSRTPLVSWFYALYAMSQTRSGVSAMQLHRELGVTYKTAWRMLRKIRELMIEDAPLEGTVEVDETFMKAKSWRDTRISKSRRSFFGGAKLIGFVERETGHARISVLPDLRQPTVYHLFKRYVKPGSAVHTDGSRIYNIIKGEYDHTSAVHWGPSTKHSGFEFHPVAGDGTQRIENLWSVFKRGIRGTYIHVSHRHLQSYANEYAFRYTHRRSPTSIFELMLNRL